MQTDKKRIEYIDLAKGVCILLVVFAHIHPDLTRYSWGVFFDSFRMPLYFFLSGIFFKRYSGIQEFAIKKVNNLIIPLLFFYAFAYLYDAVSWGIYLLSESDTSTYERYSWWPFWEIIRSGMTYHNQPLWFLTALFEVNILYYFLQRFINSWKLDIAVWVIAIGGWLAAKSGIVLPYYLGTALISLPFFHAGTWLKREELLPYSSRDKYLYASILPLGVAVWLLAEPIRLHELILPTHFLGFYFCWHRRDTHHRISVQNPAPYSPYCLLRTFLDYRFRDTLAHLSYISTYLRAFFPRRKPPLRTYFRFDDDNRNRRYRTAATICPPIHRPKRVHFYGSFPRLIAPLQQGSQITQLRTERKIFEQIYTDRDSPHTFGMTKRSAEPNGDETFHTQQAETTSPSLSPYSPRNNDDVIRAERKQHEKQPNNRSYFSSGKFLFAERCAR